MKEMLQVIAAILGVLSCFLVSLGAISPASVKRAGETFATWLSTKSSWFFFESARHLVVRDFKDEGFVKSLIHICIIQTAVLFMTDILSALLVWLAFVVLSIYGLIAYQTVILPHAVSPYGSQIVFGLSIGGLVIAFSAFLRFVAALLNVKKGRTTKALAWCLKRAGFLWHILRPFISIAFRFVKIFTVVLPRRWYNGLKVIHERGVDWLFTVGGCVLMFIAGILQIITVFMN